MPYDRLVEWVKNQSFARLDQRARKDIWYSHLHDEAGKYRGQLVALDMEILLADTDAVEEPLWRRVARSLGR